MAPQTKQNPPGSNGFKYREKFGVVVIFLNAVCALWLAGQNRYGLPLRTLFHTSHPGLAAALRRDRHWTQVSAALVGSHKGRSRESVNRSAEKVGKKGPGCAGFGGHFRAVQGFRYLGEVPACAS